MIRYQGVPAEVRAALKPHVERWRHLVPSWCHDLTFVFEADEEGAPASVSCDVEYRMATICVDPSWLEADEAERDSIIRHELVHLALEPVLAFVEGMLRRCIAEDSVFHDWTRDEFRRCYEGTVVDLAKALADGGR